MTSPASAVATTATAPTPQFSKSYRWNLLLLLAVSQAIAYMDRVNMSVVAPVLIRQYHWSPATVGVLMSMFNWTFTISLLAAGPFVDWVRARLAYPLGLGLWSLGTLLCGTTLSFTPLAVFRGMVGVGEAPMIPAGQRVIFETFSKEQRASAVATFFSGNYFGLALGIPFSALILHSWGIPWVFYVTGVISALWIPWFLYTYRGAGRTPAAAAAKSNIRWATLLKFRTTWGVMLGQAGYLYISYVFASWLPTYLVVQRKMSILKGGFIGMLPFIVGVIATILGGYMSDWLVRRGARITVARKLMTCGGLFLATVFTLWAAYTVGVVLAVILLTLAVASLRLATGSCNSMMVDIAPPHIVSSLVSLQNFGGNVGGALAPVVTGILLARTGNFQIPLLVTAGVALVFGCGSYGLIVGSLDQKLDQPPATAGASAH